MVCTILRDGAREMGGDGWGWRDGQQQRVLWCNRAQARALEGVLMEEVKLEPAHSLQVLLVTELRREQLRPTRDKQKHHNTCFPSPQ
jgi:hypothetical protein